MGLTMIDTPLVHRYSIQRLRAAFYSAVGRLGYKKTDMQRACHVQCQ